MYAPHPPTTPSFPNTLCLNSGIIGIYNEDGSKADTSLSVEQQFEYYLFTKNAQGDIINIYDKSGQHVVSYTYDAWGNHETVIEIAGYEHVSTANPFRYRGYYFDQETGYYYLNSRYYDCETRRFISSDDISYLGADGGLNSFNLYAYCGNNPVMYVDQHGTSAEWWQWVAFGVGVALAVVATAMAFAGSGAIATFGTGALIGSLAAGTIGATIGGIVGYNQNGKDGILGGMLTGFGIGSIIGFVLGGSINAHKYTVSSQPIGAPFNPNKSYQIGVDPSTLTIDRSLNKNKLETARKIIKSKGMYGVITVNRNGRIIDGNHRVYIAKILRIAVDIVVQ